MNVLFRYGKSVSPKIFLTPVTFAETCWYVLAPRYYSLEKCPACAYVWKLELTMEHLKILDASIASLFAIERRWTQLIWKY